jgi:hypothetical protein
VPHLWCPRLVQAMPNKELQLGKFARAQCTLGRDSLQHQVCKMPCALTIHSTRTWVSCGPLLQISWLLIIAATFLWQIQCIVPPIPQSASCRGAASGRRDFANHVGVSRKYVFAYNKHTREAPICITNFRTSMCPTSKHTKAKASKVG